MKADKEKTRKTLSRIFGVIGVVLVLVLFNITFVESDYVPTWGEIFNIEYEVKPDDPTDKITFIDVGMGDCILLQSNGRFGLVDTSYGEHGIREIEDVLWRKGVRTFDAVILTHWDTDHTGGFVDIEKAFDVRNLVRVNPTVSTEKDNPDIVDTVLDSAKENNTEDIIAEEGMRIRIGEIEVTVLYYDEKAKDDNESSLVLMAECKGKRFLLMGDAPFKTEENMINEGYDLDCDVLKIAHHGSNYSTSEELLKLSSPEYAILSVGGKSSALPGKETLLRLEIADIMYFRTDECGDITFTVEDDGIKLKTEK